MANPAVFWLFCFCWLNLSTLVNLEETLPLQGPCGYAFLTRLRTWAKPYDFIRSCPVYDLLLLETTIIPFARGM